MSKRHERGASPKPDRRPVPVTWVLRASLRSRAALPPGCFTRFMASAVGSAMVTDTAELRVAHKSHEVGPRHVNDVLVIATLEPDFV